MSKTPSQNDGWTFTAPYRGLPQQNATARPPPTSPQSPDLEITRLIDRLCAAAYIPKQQQDQFAILDLWDDLRALHWNAVRAHRGGAAQHSWPDFVTRSFGDRTDRVLKSVYHQQYEAMERRDWKALVRFYRVQKALGLSAPAVFLYLGRQVATSPRSLKMLCKLLDRPSAPAFQRSDVMAALNQAVAARQHDRSEPPELDHQALADAVRELRRRRRANRAVEDDVNRVAREMNGLTIDGSSSLIE